MAATNLKLNSTVEKQSLPSKNSSDSRFYELDVLRGIAAIAVVYCHFLSQCHDLGRTTSEFRWGSYGPHLFFMISGFVIFMTLDNCKRPMDFVFSRFSRLYPLYWTGVLFSTIVILQTRSTEADISWKQFIGNLTMLQTWLRIPDIEVAYWTLGVELKFYVLMFAVLYFKLAKKMEWLAVAWLGLVLSFRVVDRFVGIPNVVATPLILDYAHLFIAGMMFYRIRRDGSTWMRNALIMAVVPFSFFAEGMETTVFCVAFVGTFYLFVSGKLKWIAIRPLQFLGTISYALYMVHGSLGHALIEMLHVNQYSLFVILTLPAFVCIGVSALITFYCEQPILKRLRSWYKRKSLVRSAHDLPASQEFVVIGGMGRTLEPRGRF